MVEVEITSFVQINKGSTDVVTVWECFTSYLRKILIFQQAYRAKVHQRIRNELLSSIDLMEKQHKIHPSLSLKRGFNVGEK